MMHNRMLYGYQNTTAIVRMPETIALAVFGPTFGATATAIFITQVAVSVVTSWALQALAPKPSLGSANSASILVNAKGPAEPQQFVYGQIRKGGVVTYYETTPVNENKFLHQIIVLAGHEVDEIGDIYINDEVATFDGDFVTGEYESKLRIQKFRGDQTTAPASLDEESNQINANFVGRGIAYLYVRYEYDQDVFANGLPLITAVVKGKRVFDPRTGTTAFSSNAALCVRDYLTSAYGMNTADVDDTAFSVAANVCDEAIPLVGGGTEPRYSLNGLARADQKHSDVLANMMTACAGTLFWGGGKFMLRAGAYTAPTKVLTLDDLRSQISIDTRTNLRDQFNYVQGTFNDAGQRWITVDYPPFESSVFQAEDGGDALPLDLELPMTTSGASAQRIAKLTLFRGREQMTMTADFGLNALDVEVGEIIAFTNPRYGFDQKEFEVIGWRFGPNQDAGDLRITLSLRETSEAAFDWNAEESAIISNNTNLPSAFTGLDVTNLTISVGGRTQSDGTFVNAAILSWTAAPSAFVDHYQIEYRPVADSNFASTTTVETTIEVAPVIDRVFDEDTQEFVAAEYAFRVRAVSVTGVRGPFTSATFTVGGDVTAPGLPNSFSATGDLGFINLLWVSPSDVDLNYTEVWESPNSNFASAVKIARAFGNTFNRGNLAPLTTRYYFLRSVDFSDNKSAFVGPVNATTRQIQVGDIGPAVIQYDDFATDVTTLFDNIESNFNSIAANIGQLETDTVALDADVTTLQSQYTTLDGNVTTNTTVISGIETRVTSAEGSITANSSSITSLQSNLTNTNTNVTANATAISGLDTRVTSTEGSITANSSSITSLQSDLTTLDGTVSGQATAISGLDTRVTDAEGDITAQASAITSLSTTVGTNTTSITQVTQSVDGIEGKFGVTIDNNGAATGFQLLSGVGGSAFNVRADQFAVFNAQGAGGNAVFVVRTSPTTLPNGTVVPAGAYVDKVFVTDLSAISATIGKFQSAANGERVEIEDDRISVFDSSNVLRVRIGRL